MFLIVEISGNMISDIKILQAMFTSEICIAWFYYLTLAIFVFCELT